MTLTEINPAINENAWNNLAMNGIDTLVLDAHKLVRSGGELVFVQSSVADIPRSIQLMTECGMNVQVVGETSGPFRDYYHEDAPFMREMAKSPGA